MGRSSSPHCTALAWRGDHVSEERSQWARPKTKKAKKKDMCDVPSKCDAHVGGGEGGEGRFKRHKAKFLDAGYVEMLLWVDAFMMSLL